VDEPVTVVNQFALYPHVQAAIITLLGMLATFILNLAYNIYNNHRHRKYETKTKFFYEMYPKRLEVYDEVDDVLTEICQFSSKLNKLDRANASEIIISDMYNLKRLSHKLSVYGSVDTWRIISGLHIQIKEISSKYLDFDVDIVTPRKIAKFSDEIALAEFILNTVAAVNASYTAFTDSVRAESGENYIDKEITEFLKNAAGKKGIKKNKKRIS
jgi:hypothetical protein